MFSQDLVISIPTIL